ncbi:MAG: UPF0179 family protein [Thermoplasmata archaeon]|nr:UPF0179 family protein [Thermoplasmata archaeon]
MVLLTVIGKTLAKPDAEFIFTGSNSSCKDCKVKTICFHLDQGTKYKIISARDIVHDCPQHDEGVVVVQVEEVPRNIVISKRQAMEGTTITFEVQKCSQRGCQHYQFCLPIGMESGLKRKVIKVQEKVDCIEGHDRMMVILE